MRICFIGDSSSIHVQRIVSHHVRKKDEILVLSFAQRVSNIDGSTAVHLVNHERESDRVFMPIDMSFRDAMVMLERLAQVC